MYRVARFLTCSILCCFVLCDTGRTSELIDRKNQFQRELKAAASALVTASPAPAPAPAPTSEAAVSIPGIDQYKSIDFDALDISTVSSPNQQNGGSGGSPPTAREPAPTSNGNGAAPHARDASSQQHTHKPKPIPAGSYDPQRMVRGSSGPTTVVSSPPRFTAKPSAAAVAAARRKSKPAWGGVLPAQGTHSGASSVRSAALNHSIARKSSLASSRK